MIRHILEFLDHAKLARTVILQTRQLDHLDRLCAHLQDALDVAETATPVRDARSTEAEVLSVCHAWSRDAEQTARAQLNRAEVTLSEMNADVRRCHELLSGSGVPFARGASVLDRIGLLVAQRREAEQGWSQASAEIASLRRADDTHGAADSPRTLPSRPHPEMACTGTEGGAE